MQKPNGYEAAKAYGDFTPLKLGGHVCKIMGIEETQSTSGKDMLKINLDIAEGEQKGYFADQYKNSTFDNKKWGCIVYQLVYDADGNTNRGLKTFLDSVESSNAGYKVQWGNNFCQSLKGKLVGGVFGREQYLNRNDELKWSTKCVQFRNVETIRKGVEVPEDKYLDSMSELTDKARQGGVNVHNSNDNKDYVEIDSDSDLPF
jgi:hypothetical protein